ncbi:MAG: hypothetical protein WAU28_01675 [Candidatus Moraniibacteriota bacterium]
MQPYNDRDGDSNVDAFEIGNDYIKVQFHDGSVYIYTYMSAGSNHIENMKRLACEHNGLNAYINKYKPRYQSKF